jgi:hypothetical protein
MDQPNQAESGKPGIVAMAKGQEVSLTLGTLILIAIIVAFCSGAGGKTDMGPTERKLDAMDRKLQEIEKKIDEIGKKTKKE